MAVALDHQASNLMLTIRNTSVSISTQTPVARWVRSTSRAVCDFFYPAHCIACGYSISLHEEHLCGACWDRLPLAPTARCQRCSYAPPEAVDPAEASSLQARADTDSADPACPNCNTWTVDPERVLAWARFDDITSDLVHAIKFGGKRRLARLVGYRLGCSPALREDLREVDVLVPVPLHSTRQRERGYNQSLCIAQGLADALDKPLALNLVKRSRATQQQAKLDGGARFDNVHGAFEACGRAPANPLIGLVDDVSTTGATIADCGRALKAAGARSVWGVVVASAFRRA